MCQDCDKQHVYNIHCLDCCARLVRSAKPSRQHAENLIGQIKILGGPSADAIKRAMRETAQNQAPGVASDSR